MAEGPNPDGGRAAVHWSPRVPKWKLRRLYERSCAGIWDDELIDDVGMTLFMRCRDILVIHRAQEERLVACPRCDDAGAETLVPRAGLGRDRPFACPRCGWSMTWRAYQRTFKRRQLNPGGAVECFRRYMAEFEAARDPRERMLAIDRVVHTFHRSLRTDPTRPTRPASVNLVSGDLAEVVAFLDELSGMDLPGPMREVDSHWREEYRSTYWPGILAERDAPSRGRPAGD